MRKLGTTITCIYFLIQGASQVNSIDSLKNLLVQASEDSAKVKSLVYLSGRMQDLKPDSALFYAKQALELSHRLDYYNGEINSLGEISDAYLSTGNYSRAMETALNCLRKSEQKKDSLNMAGSLSRISRVYSYQGDNERALKYLFQVRDLSKGLSNESYLNATLINIGYTYYNLKRLDSARIFINEALEMSLRRADNMQVGACYLNLGMIHTQMKLYDLAKNYYHLSLPYFSPTDHYFVSSVQVGLAEVFDSTKQADSAFYYARRSYQHAKAMGSPDQVMYPTKELASLFKKTHQQDSALFYQDIVMELKDSLSNQQKVKQIETLTFNEQIRQMDLEKEKIEQEDDHKRNLQIAGVAIFIPVFFGLVLLLSRNQIQPRVVEFLGILFLLFVFEFISLFSHPFIGKWTHESPVWMLLIFIAIALVLVPLHHRSEKWIKQQVVAQRNKALKKRIKIGQEAQRKLES